MTFIMLKKKLSLFYYSARFIFERPSDIYKFLLYLYYKILKKTPVLKLKVLNKKKMVLDLDSHIDRTIFFHEYVEKELSDFLSKYLKKESTFFDIGANSGYFSLLTSTIIENGSIHAFEPVQYIYNNFSKSVKINNIKNIFINNVCVGSKNKKVDFYVASHSDVSSIRKTDFQKSSKKIKCKMITLESYCDMKNIKRIDMIKIDTEGNEFDILRGSMKILKRFKPVLIIEFSNKTTESFGYHPNIMYDYLTGLGYKIFSYSGSKIIPQNKKDYYEEDLFCFYKF
ncbi:MAG: FkbM family methyltransferase [Candidatus Levybacteria bacterium]|nr:FkbM family methyltransferase [Candidatus Levybacteria bacterium]